MKLTYSEKVILSMNEDDLIREFELIEQKKSKLSAKAEITRSSSNMVFDNH